MKAEPGSPSPSPPDRSSPPSRKLSWPLLILIVIVLVGAGLRFWRLGAKSLWLDECMSARLAAMPTFGAMLKEIRSYDVHPPLYQSVLFVAMQFGRGEAVARAPSALAGVAAIVLIFFVGRRLFGEAAGLVAAGLLAVSSYHVYFSQDARLHALIVCLALAHTLAFLRLMDADQPAGWGWHAVYAALGVICLYTYVLSILAFVAQWAIFLGARRWDRRAFLRWLACHLLIGMAFVPWLPVLLARVARVTLIASQAQTRPALGVTEAAFTLKEWLAGPAWLVPTRELAVAAVGFFAVVCAVAVLAAGQAALRRWRVRMARTDRRAMAPAWILALLLGMPLACFFLLPIPRAHLYESKHLILLQPLAVLGLAGLILGGVARGRFRLAQGVLCVGFLLLNAAGLWHYYRGNLEKEPWRQLVAEVSAREQPGDAILLNPAYVGHAFEWYYQGETPTAGVPEKPGAFEEQMRARLRESIRRVWLIQCKNRVSSPVATPQRWLEANWRREGAITVRRGILGGTQGGLSYAVYRRPARKPAAAPDS